MRRATAALQLTPLGTGMVTSLVCRAVKPFLAKGFQKATECVARR